LKGMKDRKRKDIEGKIGKGKILKGREGKKRKDIERMGREEEERY